MPETNVRIYQTYGRCRPPWSDACPFIQCEQTFAALVAENLPFHSRLCSSQCSYHLQYSSPRAKDSMLMFRFILYLQLFLLGNYSSRNRRANLLGNQWIRRQSTHKGIVTKKLGVPDDVRLCDVALPSRQWHFVQSYIICMYTWHQRTGSGNNVAITEYQQTGSGNNVAIVYFLYNSNIKKLHMAYGQF